jgi:hypothetical protein
MIAYADAATFADWIDALRLREGPAEPEQTAPLSMAVEEGLNLAATDYERQAQKRSDRRRGVGAIVVGADTGVERSIGVYLAERLCLRVLDVDAAAIEFMDEVQVRSKLATFSDSTAHAVVVHGVGSDTSARVIQAIEWADPDVLVVVCAEQGMTFSPAFKWRCNYAMLATKFDDYVTS